MTTRTTRIARRFTLLSALTAAVACFASPSNAQTLPPGAAPVVTACPTAVPVKTVCHTGLDANGAYYLIAMPENWNRVLVMHSHGGPDLAAPSSTRSAEDLTRWAIMVKAGYAWAGSTFRRGGYGVRMAAEDTENLRQLFLKTFGQPRRTIMHGQSWGGNVGAKVTELYGHQKNPDGSKAYDGTLLTSGVLGGGTRGYDYRIDLRVVYQYYCNNHPRADEPQYPLWIGLPLDSAMTPRDLAARVNECTGVQLAPEKRTDAQRRALANILNVTRVPERTLIAHLSWGTFLFSDIVHWRLHGRNPFSTTGVRYSGSEDDAALNRGVARYRADPRALAELAHDSDLTGKVSIPVLTLHAIDDPTAFVEHEAAYRRVRERAGTAALLVQTFSKESEHSYLATPQYPALLEALLAWIDKGEKPSPQSVAALCGKYTSAYEGGCHFDTTYRPQPYESRVYPRQR